MLNTLFIIFIVICVAYFLIAPRKETPMMILTQGLLQYLWTLGMWGLRLQHLQTSVLLGIMVATTMMLLWASRLKVGTSFRAAQLFFTVGGWAVLVMLGIFSSLNGPFIYSTEIAGHPIEIHPAIRFSGNLMLFLFFLQLVLNRLQHWTVKHSLITLGPGIIYFGFMLFLRYLQTEIHQAQIS